MTHLERPCAAVRKSLGLLGATIAVLSLVVAHAHADSSFFEGKTLRMLVGSGPGGGNDTYSRLIARHMPKYIPGKPVMIVQNMPGAGGLVATNYLYNRAPRDGTVVGHVQWQSYILQIVKRPGAKFDLTKMTALGAAATQSTILYVRKDRFSSLQKLIQSDQRAKIASSGPSNSYMVARLVEEAVGKKLFDFILGYRSGRDFTMAVRRGEADGAGTGKDGLTVVYLGDMWKAGELVAIAQTPIPQGGRDPDFPDVPLVTELATTPQAKALVEGAIASADYGRPYHLPPGVPPERVKILREAFWKAMHDEKLLNEAKKMGRHIDPMSGDQLQRLWEKALRPSPAIVKFFEDIFKRG